MLQFLNFRGDAKKKNPGNDDPKPFHGHLLLLHRDRLREEKKRKREIEEQQREDEDERRKKSSTGSKKKAKESAATTKGEEKEDASAVAEAEEAVVSANEVPAREVTQHPRAKSSQAVSICSFTFAGMCVSYFVASVVVI